MAPIGYQPDPWPGYKLGNICRKRYRPLLFRFFCHTILLVYNDMSKTLSIVIPVYNEEKFLGACLQSIADQTVRPDEVIVVDNNSTDRSLEIAASFPFVRIIKEKEQGIVSARNTGFDAVQSDVIGRIDADTVLPSNWVARVKRFYQRGHNDNAALSGGGYFYNVRCPRINGWIQSQLVYRLNRFIIGHYTLWGSNMAMPRQLWLGVRDTVCSRQDIHEDLDLSFHLHALKVNIAYHSNLRVGVGLKRIFDWQAQKYHMRRWPQSLRVHGYRRWWLGVVGNWLLWYIVQPIGYIAEYGSRLVGRAPLDVK